MWIVNSDDTGACYYRNVKDTLQSIYREKKMRVYC